jgi:hypothetical protein
MGSFNVEALPGGNTLAGLKSVSQISQTKGDHALPENEPVTLPPTQIANYAKEGKKARQCNFSPIFCSWCKFFA